METRKKFEQVPQNWLCQAAGAVPGGGEGATRSERQQGGNHLHILKCSPKYTRRTSALFTISDGVPWANTWPSLMM